MTREIVRGARRAAAVLYPHTRVACTDAGGGGTGAAGRHEAGRDGLGRASNGRVQQASSQSRMDGLLSKVHVRVDWIDPWDGTGLGWVGSDGLDQVNSYPSCAVCPSGLHPCQSRREAANPRPTKAPRSVSRRMRERQLNRPTAFCCSFLLSLVLARDTGADTRHSTIDTGPIQMAVAVQGPGSSRSIALDPLDLQGTWSPRSVL